MSDTTKQPRFTIEHHAIIRNGTIIANIGTQSHAPSVQDMIHLANTQPALLEALKSVKRLFKVTDHTLTYPRSETVRSVIDKINAAIEAAKP